MEIYFHEAAWVGGYRVAEFFGPVTVEIYFDDMDLESAQDEMHHEMARKAAGLGANAVIGFEVTVDPFDEKGVRLSGIGTACVLEPLF